MTQPVGSPSIELDDYWWYVARSRLLETIFGSHVGSAHRSLDVGSADAPSATWLRSPQHVTLDLDARGLKPGGVCASAMNLPFRDAVFDVVSAFDVIEHCDPEHDVLSELARVLRPGGRLMVAVPAYEWAWTHHDDNNGHVRRYTRSRLVAALERADLKVVRATYFFAGTFPFFAAERGVRRMVERGHRRGSMIGPGEVPPVPRLPRGVATALLGLSRLDERVLRRRDLPVGSSVAALAFRG